MADNSEKKNILICDDDELLRDFYARVLNTRGYNTLPAENGDVAISILEEVDDISLAIVDLLMPIRTGWELIEFMRSDERFKNIPIIAITGLAASPDEFEKVKVACEMVMYKGSFDLDTFNQAVDDLT